MATMGNAQSVETQVPEAKGAENARSQTNTAAPSESAKQVRESPGIPPVARPTAQKDKTEGAVRVDGDMDWEPSKPQPKAKPEPPKLKPLSTMPPTLRSLPSRPSSNATPTPTGTSTPNGDATPTLNGSSQSPRRSPRSPATPATTRSLPMARSSRGRGGKVMLGRKRKFSTSMTVTTNGMGSDESEEETSLDGVQTKSGRKVQRPDAYNPADQQTPTRRKIQRAPSDVKICKICQRGNSPAGNLLVFCDMCNCPFHQKCHVPNVERESLMGNGVEWYCNACALAKKMFEVPDVMMDVSEVPEQAREEVPEEVPEVPEVPEKEPEPNTTGEGLTEDEKRKYLSSLSQSNLVELLLLCEKMHSDVPIYNPKTKELVERLKTAPVPAAATPPTPTVLDSPPTAASPIREANGERINYEDMIITAIKKLNDPQGSPPKEIYKYLANHYPLLAGRDIRAEGTAVLNRLLKSGRLLRENHLYRVSERAYEDPEIVPSPGLENFPAPGFGIQLPPESEDADYLIQKTPIGFSHMFPGLSNGVRVA